MIFECFNLIGINLILFATTEGKISSLYVKTVKDMKIIGTIGTSVNLGKCQHNNRGLQGRVS